MWMGAHPKAPSMAVVEKGEVSLGALIDNDPEGVLGQATAGRFGGRLPFLLKVLAAERPLSIQAHPDKSQAAAGFARENQAGVPLDAPDRNYKDDNHKPECICALSEFHALCGFREIDEIAGYFFRVLPEAAVDSVLGKKSGNAGLQAFFRNLMQMPAAQAAAIVDKAAAYAVASAAQDPVFEWIAALSAEYPGDIGALAPAFLNLVVLSPGQAMFLPAGVLHAYLRGTGIELMANSDNVLRGGLTPKHVDVPELLKVLDFSPMLPPVLHPVAVDVCERFYPTDAAEFNLSVIEVSPEQAYGGHTPKSAEILLCTRGDAVLHESVSGEDFPFHRGQSLFIHAAAGAYTISGNAVLYRAAVPV